MRTKFKLKLFYVATNFEKKEKNCHAMMHMNNYGLYRKIKYFMLTTFL